MNRNILKLAVPNIVSNITMLLLGLIDLALMGHLSSEAYIGAISLGSVIFNFKSKILFIESQIILNLGKQQL